MCLGGSQSHLHLPRPYHLTGLMFKPSLTDIWALAGNWLLTNLDLAVFVRKQGWFGECVF